MLYLLSGIVSFPILLTWKHNKRSAGIAVVLVLFLIGGLNSQRPDYQVYLDFFQYHNLNLGSIREPIYLLLNTVAYNMGMSYSAFFAVQVGFSLFLLYRTVSYFTDNAATVLVLYMLFPFAINVVQIRFFLASSFCLYGLVFLYQYYRDGHLRDLALFFVFTLLGGLIHFATLFFLVCIVPAVLRKQKSWVVYFLAFVFGLFLSNIDILFEFVVPIIGVRKATFWFLEAERFSLFHILVILAIRTGIVAVIFLCSRFTRNNGNSTLSSGSSVNAIALIDDFINNILVFLVISVVPLELFSQQFDRYSRFYIVLFYILISRKMPRVSHGNRAVICAMLCVVLFCVYYYEYSRGSATAMPMWDTVFRQIFEHNLLLGN